MRLSILGTLAALSLFAVAPAARGHSLLVNGGFETPSVAAGSYQVFGDGADIGGWTAVGSQIAISSTSFTQNGFSFPAQEGNQWADLSGSTSNGSEGVEQSAATTPGAQYDLRFWVGNIVDPSGVFGSTSTVTLYIDGVQQLGFTNSNGAGSTTQNWEEFSYFFTAAGNSTLIRFANADPSTDNSNGLDNVSLTPSTSPPPAVVPLPPALAQAAVMALVLAGAFAVGRVRKMPGA